MKSYKLSIYIASAITVMSAVLLGCAPAKTAGLTFTDGGEVVGVGGRIAVSEGGDITISTASGDTYSLTVPRSSKAARRSGLRAVCRTEHCMLTTRKKKPTLRQRSTIRHSPHQFRSSTPCHSRPKEKRASRCGMTLPNLFPSCWAWTPSSSIRSVHQRLEAR